LISAQQNAISRLFRLLEADARHGKWQTTAFDRLKANLLLSTLIALVSTSIFADTAILVALPAELDSVRREDRLVGQPVELAGHKVSIGYRKGEKIYIVRTGAGNLNSAMVTEGLIARYRIDRVISIGIAGNLNDNWKPGDLIVATNVVSHQAGKETPDGFETKEQQPAAVSRQLSADYLNKCETLREATTEIATAFLRQTQNDDANQQRQARTPAPPDPEKLKADRREPRASLRSGKLVSGDSFIASSAKRKWLHETFKADAVDMVSAGIARVCEANGVPYVIIRVLSDNADESASADFAAFVQKYKDPVTAEIALKMIDQIARPQP
jgi:adenosylhomocysteine nucleosidase